MYKKCVLILKTQCYFISNCIASQKESIANNAKSKRIQPNENLVLMMFDL